MGVVFFFAFWAFFSASGNADRSEENIALQAGKPGHVRLGDPGPAAFPADMRPQHDTVGQLGQSDTAKRRHVDGRYDFEW